MEVGRVYKYSNGNYNIQQLYSNSMNNPGTTNPQRRLYTHLKIQTKKTDSKTAIQCQPHLPLGTSPSPHHHPSPETIFFSDSENVFMGSPRFQDCFDRIRKLGEGAHTCVYQYIDRRTRRNYAVKVFKDCDSDRVKDVMESFRIMRTLDHPCVIKAYSLYIDEPTSNCYLVTQISQFKDLRCFIETESSKSPRISQQRVANIMYQILLALSYFKEKGICHRDIKPENILYDPITGDIKIIDFQVSKMKKYQDQAFQMWTYTGSLLYRAPESFFLGYSDTVDMWAAGVVAYQLLTGTLPFTSTSIKGVTEDIMHKQINLDIHPLSRESKNFVKWLLEKDPKVRWTPKEALSSPFLLKSEPKSPKLQLKTTSETCVKKFENIQHKRLIRDQNVMENFDIRVRRSRSSVCRRMSNK